MYSLKSIVRVNGSVYIVDDIVISEFIKNESHLKHLKDSVNATHIFNTGFQTLFCTEIEELEIIEDIIETAAKEPVKEFKITVVETTYPESVPEVATEEQVASATETKE